MSKKEKIIIIICLVLVVVISGVSFALWRQTDEQTGKNRVTAGCFKLTLNDKDVDGLATDINLEAAFPVTDQSGQNTKPYTFKLQNTCKIDANYMVSIAVIGNNTLSEEYLKLSLNAGTPKMLDRLKNNYDLEDYNKAYKVTTGYLNGSSENFGSDGGSATYDLRLWVDENTPETEMNKEINLKVVISTLPGNETFAEDDSYNVGDKIYLGNETFYVISQTDDTITALARYNLLVGMDYQGQTYCNSMHIQCDILDTTEGYGLQNKYARGYYYDESKGESIYSLGTLAFSSNNYYQYNSFSTSIIDNQQYPYVLNDNAWWETNVWNEHGTSYQKRYSIYDAIEWYGLYLRNHGYSSVTSRLMTREEAEMLQNVGKNNLYDNSSFWLGSASGYRDGSSSFMANSEIFTIYNGDISSSYPTSSYDKYGVRPVITINKSELN